MSSILRHRYERLLAAYPPDWRADHGTVVLGTLLDAARDGQRWPSPREALALLVGGVRTRARRALAADPRRRWIDGLHLGVVLVTLASLAEFVRLAAGFAASQFGPATAEVHSTLDLDGWWDFYALNGSIGLAGVALAILVLRGRMRAAAVAAALNVLAHVGATLAVAAAEQAWGQDAAFALTPADLAWSASTPLVLALLVAILARSGGTRPRPRSWGWLLPAVALGAFSTFASQPTGTLVQILTLAAMVVALAVALATGETRPAVALAVYGMPSLLLTAAWTARDVPLVWTGTLSATPGVLAVALAAAAWLAAYRLRRRTPDGPTP